MNKKHLSPEELKDNERLCAKVLDIFYKWHLVKSASQIVMELRHLLAAYDEDWIYDGDHLYKIYLQWTLANDQIENTRGQG